MAWMTFPLPNGQLWALTDADREQLRVAYPHHDLATELEKARIWLVVNPRRRKRNVHRFLVAWLNRATPTGRPVGHDYGEWTCPHDPECSHPSRCRFLSELAAEKVRG